MRSEHIDLLTLCRIKGVSWYLVAREARRLGGLDALLGASPSEKSREATEARELIRAARPHLDKYRAEAESVTEVATAAGLALTTILDGDYPLNLRTIFNAPPFLFYRGGLDAEKDARSIAVVGTREASAEGLRRAGQMAKLLVKNGVSVVSGLARGIDTAGHKATLAARGRTVAVLGSGLLRIYPPENADLAAAIAERGAVVSQFWPEAPPTRTSFPTRNITMSGFAQGTVVIEASATSGAKLQARLALQHGRRVFLVSSLVMQQPWARTYVDRGAIEVKGIGEIVAALRSPDDVRARGRTAQQITLGFD